ncbi:hypothetical protein EUGRSUZ_C03503 [Eucalyptus grandis]|uniref:Uncharacterized protein n=2 Tax=Eucalyptus grandis TaxID=71139 RepID=A0ACC3LIW9_EUCGR|nr:hypothetical protein EUGRSUZ_C03503 [Eucalyptus grandis]
MMPLLFVSPSFVTYKRSITSSLKLITRIFPLIREHCPKNHLIRTNYFYVYLVYKLKLQLTVLQSNFIKGGA